MAWLRGSDIRYFNSHASARRDLRSPSLLTFLLNFNSHASARRDNTEPIDWTTDGHFNSHASARRDIFGRAEQSRHRDFNSHASARRDGMSRGILHENGISTHTPLRGVTQLRFGIQCRNGNFNSHASARRDLTTAPPRRSDCIFQLTRLCEA